jgi:transposase
MKFVNPLTEAEKATLESMYNNHPLPMTRKRAQTILLSNQRYSIPYISEIVAACRQSVSAWITNWDEIGLAGLIEKARSGRPRKLTLKEENEVIERIIEEPRSIKKVLAEITKKTGITICRETLRRICKRAGLNWKRVRKSLKSKRNAQAYEESFNMIVELLEQEQRGQVDVFFYDESSFDLQPCIPYAWQEKDEQIELPTSRSKKLNVLGFLNKSCHLESFVFEGIVNTDIIVACFDEFLKTINKPTYIFMDNASTHTSDLFLEQLQEWEEKGLFIRNISAYSPELNIIEILWRKIKYEWISFSAYDSFKSLKDNLFDILKKVGSEYVIAFT